MLGQINQLSARSSKSARPQLSKRSDSARSVANSQYIVNPVFLGAVQQTSKFEKELEDDFENADQTLQFDTERLKLFPEEYEIIKNMDDDENRILAK